MNLKNHLSIEQKIDFIEGHLDPVELTEVSKHISSGCQDCAQSLSVFNRMFKAIQATLWPSPSPQIHNKAVRSFELVYPIRTKPSRPIVFHPIFVGLALIVIVLIILFRGLPPHTAYAASLDGVTGNVDMKISRGSAWQSTSSGQSFPIGAMIRTSSDGNAVLKFPGGDLTTLGPNTQLELAGLNQTDGLWQIMIGQSSGRTENVSSSNTSLFRIQTTVGTADTNNADFNLGVEEDGTTIVNVKQGTVRASSPGGFVLVTSGQTVLLHQNKPPATLLPSPTRTAPASTPSATLTPNKNTRNNQIPKISPTQNGLNQPDGTLNKTPSGSNTSDGSQQNNQSQPTSPSQGGTQQQNGNNQEATPDDDANQGNNDGGSK